MKMLTALPSGDWSMIVFRGDLIFVCPEHAPRLWDASGQVMLTLGGSDVFAINTVPPAEEDPQMPLVMPGSETKQ